jgi:hypothetical protein
MEIWKDIIGYEGYYQISNTGRVKALARKINIHNNNIRIARERILKPIGRGANGEYIGYNLSKNRKNIKFSAHRLVAQHFIANPNNHPVVSHIDNNPTNNHVSNLQWVTQSTNILHCVASKRHRHQIS